MSTDTYFDFHSEESCSRWNNWTIWSGFLKDCRAKGGYEEERKHYDVDRVGYLHNFVANCNYDLWDKLHDLIASGSNEKVMKQVDEELISGVVAIWKEIYRNAHDPENDTKFCCDDLATPEEIEKTLREHLGWYLYLRVD